MNSRLQALMLLLPLASGCGAPTVPVGVTELRPLADFHVGTALTEEECRDFSAEVERVAAEGDAEAFEALFDWEALLDRATAGVPVPPGVRQDFVKETRDSAGKLCREALAHVENGGSYRLLRVHFPDDQPRVQFRLVIPGGGVNYHDLMLARRPDGIRIVDVDVLLAGESLAGTARRLFLPQAAQASQGFWGRWFGPDRAYLRSIGKLRELADLVRAGKNEEALIACEQMPEALRTEKVVLLLRLRAAQPLDDERYQEAMAAFRASHPDDPCIDLISLDHHILSGEFDEALAGLDRLDKAVGGDPYLNVLRAGVYAEAGRLNEARNAARAVVAAQPEWEDGYWAVLSVALQARRFGEAVTALETLDETFGVVLEELADQPEYTELFRSEEFRRWNESRARARKPVKP